MPPDRESEKLAHLLRIGRTRGHVFYDEIDRILAPGREAVAELDTILSELTMNSIEVIDEPRTEDSVPDESYFEREEIQGHFGDSVPLRMYLREVLMVPRLTAHEEKELARRLNEASSMLPTSDVRTANQDAKEAEKRLIEANLWIALATATHFANRGLRFLDLIQEGNIGLMRAVREYNYLRTYSFPTYATWWVRKAIIQSLRDNDAKQRE